MSQGRRLWCIPLLIACLASCRPSTALSDLDRWGLPSDILLYQNQIESLSLPEAVDRLDWLPQQGKLRRLSVSRSAIRDLAGLPTTVTALDLSYTQVTDLGEVPDTVTLLDLTGTDAADLSTLPRKIKVSSLAVGGPRLEDLDGLPSALVDLRVTNANIHSLGDLPSGLKSLSLSGLTLDTIGRLPASLISLSLERVVVEDLGALPGGLQSLKLLPGTTSQHISLEDLPPFLVNLIAERNYVPDISRQRYLRSLDVRDALLKPELLPDTLGELKLNRTLLDQSAQPKAKPLKFILPKSLRSLSLVNTKTVDFDGLPVGIRSLDISSCANTSLGPLPDSLRELNLSSCMLSSLRGLPGSLKVIDLSDNIKLATLNGLPPNLRSLTLRWSKFSELPQLPSTLRTLDLTGSAGLSKLASLPPNLESLNVSQTALQRLPPLPLSLKSLDVSNSRITNLEGLEKTKLIVLRLGTGQVTSLRGLPSSVRVLEFYDL